MPPIYLLHPMAVHFPIAILILGFFVGVLSVFKAGGDWTAKAESWLLWLGTLAAWITMGLGLLAERTVPHVPMAWKAMYDHKHLAFWTVGIFSVLSLWRWRLENRWRRAFFMFWAVALGLLIATAYHGGELVFTFGVGGPGGS